MKETISKALDNIVETMVNFNGKDLYIENWKEISGHKISVFTDGQTMVYLVEEIEEKFLNKIQPAKNEIQTRKSGDRPASALAKIGYVPSPENAELKETLMETLRKVKSDPAAIPQAKAVVGIASAMVSIQKAEIEMIRLSEKI